MFQLPRYHALCTTLLLGVGVLGISIHPISAKASPAQVTLPNALTLSWLGGSQAISSSDISSWFSVSSSIYHAPSAQTEAVSPQFCEWPYDFCSFALSESLRFSRMNVSAFTINKPAVEQYLTHLKDETRIPPIDARFSRDETTNRVAVFSPSRDGSEIDIQASLEAIETALQSKKTDSYTIPLATTSILPAITETNANTLGIENFLGEGRTNFSGSTKNRIHNITRALEQYQGVLLAPGEELSFVQLLGEVDGEHGYLPELVIKRGKTQPEFGGGICQVSTTLFRAALNTGMKITMRRNHAYPVSYYKPYGMDATIYIPSPDLRFVNNTRAHILIQGAIEGKELVFRFYGTSDGRRVAIDGPHILESHPDGSMKTIFNQKVTDKDGNIFINDDFRSSYESPSKYPHPGEQTLTAKPEDWSEKQWKTYLAQNAH